MKTLFFAFLALVSVASAQVSTFNGHKFVWGWSGKTYSKEAVVAVLKQNENTDPLEIQSKIDGVTSAEFLWKVTPDMVDKAMKTSSSFLTGETATNVVLTFEASGHVETTLYLQDRLIGRIRGWTSSKRGKEQYSQLAQGKYKVKEIILKGWSSEFNCPMENKIRLEGGDALERGVDIHSGDISGPTRGPDGEMKNQYHGCIRVTKPSGDQLVKIMPKGTVVTVVWK